MRICIVSLEYPPETGWGGVGTQTRHKARGLAARGHEVHVVSATWGASSTTGYDERALIHRICAPVLDPLACDGPALWIGWSILAARKVREMEDQRPFDVIQFPDYGAEGFIYQTDSFSRRSAKVSVQLHGPISMFAEQSGWPPVGSAWHKAACFLEQSVIQHSDLVMASSRNTANFCAKKYGYPGERIEVIHSAVDTQLFSPAPPSKNARGPQILFVGKLSRSKGFDSLVAAILSLRAQFPDICLRAVGRATEPELLSNLKSKIEAEGAERNFEFYGSQPYSSLPAHYAWCDMFCGPSLNEPGPGNVYLEAAACGRCVIACNTDGTVESVLDGVTGRLVPPNSPRALAEAIRGLAQDPALFKRLGSNGRDWVLRQFSLPVYLDRVEKLYQQLLESK